MTEQRRSRAPQAPPLQVFAGESHAQYELNDHAPETKEAFGELTAFFDKHLGR
jgi:monoterpene epsilon-lactone hydrolase